MQIRSGSFKLHIYFFIKMKKMCLFKDLNYVIVSSHNVVFQCVCMHARPCMCVFVDGSGHDW